MLTRDESDDKNAKGVLNKNQPVKNDLGQTGMKIVWNKVKQKQSGNAANLIRQAERQLARHQSPLQLTASYERECLEMIKKIDVKTAFSSFFLLKNKFTGNLVTKKVIPAKRRSQKKIYYEIRKMMIFSGKKYFLEIHGYWRMASGTAVFMEYFNGIPLDAFFRQKTITNAILKGILRKILKAIRCLHSHYFIHRNITGDTILVNENEIKIIGFTTAAENCTETSGYFGRMGYVAPEVLAHRYRKKPLPYGIPIQENGVSFPSGLNTLLEDLLRQLLNPDPKQRITAKKALRHPYFSDTSAETDTILRTVESSGINDRKKTISRREYLMPSENTKLSVQPPVDPIAAVTEDLILEEQLALLLQHIPPASVSDIIETLELEDEIQDVLQENFSPCLETNLEEGEEEIALEQLEQYGNTPQRPYVCQVSGCGKRYTDPSSLRKHSKSNHPDKKDQSRKKIRGGIEELDPNVVNECLVIKSIPPISHYDVSPPEPTDSGLGRSPRGSQPGSSSDHYPGLSFSSDTNSRSGTAQGSHTSPSSYHSSPPIQSDVADRDKLRLNNDNNRRAPLLPPIIQTPHPTGINVLHSPKPRPHSLATPSLSGDSNSSFSIFENTNGNICMETLTKELAAPMVANAIFPPPYYENFSPCNQNDFSNANEELLPDAIFEALSRFEGVS